MEVDIAEVERRHRAVEHAGEQHEHAVLAHHLCGLAHEWTGRHGDDDVVGATVIGVFANEGVDCVLTLSRVEDDELPASGFGHWAEHQFGAVHALLVEVETDDRAWAVLHLDSALHVHLSHGTAGTNDDGDAAGDEIGAVAFFAPCFGDVVRGGAEVGGVVVVQAADVGLGEAVERLGPDHGHGAAEGDGLGDLFDEHSAGLAEGENVIEAGFASVCCRLGGDVLCGQSVIDNDRRSLATGFFDPASNVLGNVGEHDCRWVSDALAARVFDAVVGGTNDPHGAAVHWRKATALGVCANDARPWLGQGSAGVADVIVDRNHIGAIVGVEDLRTYEVVLDQPARDGVAVCGALAVDMDIGLDRQTLTLVVLASKAATDLDNGDRWFVPETGRLGTKVAAIELCVIATLLDELHVGEAQTDSIDANEQLIVGWFDGKILRFRSSILAHCLDTLAVGIPREICWR